MTTRRPPLPSEVREHLQVLEDRLRALAEGAAPQEVVDDADRASELAFRAAWTHGEEKRAGRPSTAAVVSFAEVIATNVRQIRNEAGVTQEELAEHMTAAGFDWKRVTVAEVEGGSRRVQLEELVGLAGVFGLSVVNMLELGPNYLRIGSSRTLSHDEVVEMFGGEGWASGAVGPDWQIGAKAAGAVTGDGDRRPARQLHQRRQKGYGAGKAAKPPRKRGRLAPKPGGDR